MLPEIELTSAEQELHDQITWEPAHVDHDTLYGQRETVAKLAKWLLERNAIPEVRWAYFDDPALNASNSRLSRKQVFENNGTSGEEILKHPNFIPYLWYFIHGPKLPKPIIQGFCQIIEDDSGTSGVVMDQAKKFARKAVRDQRLDAHKAGEEFFKLCHEIDKGGWAEMIRTAAKTARK